MKNPHLLRRIALLFPALACAAVYATPSCNLGSATVNAAKPNKLYLYFPAADDKTYPEFGDLPVKTSPATRFDVTKLTNYTGTEAQLKEGIFDVVSDDYCEFNVQIIQTTTLPPTTVARRNVVAIGTDNPATTGLFGIATAVDTGDGTLIDFARVWGGTYQTLYGGAGDALHGPKSTVARWSYAIGGTVAHEGGHNYGLAHGDGLIQTPGEDELVHHLMAAGSTYSGEDRAGYRRHFSDREYSLLAANLGLSVQTVWSWDLVNPNQQTATQLRMTILSTQATLTVSGSYSGPMSPWVNPTISAALGNQVFKGKTYKRFEITWATGQPWSGGIPGGPGTPAPAGKVAGGQRFHVGAYFTGVDINKPDPIIVTAAQLLGANNGVLALHPRVMGFDSGTLDVADGAFSVNAVNTGAAAQLEGTRTRLLPRLASIDSMVGGEELMDVRKSAFSVWKSNDRATPESKTVPAGDSVPILVAHARDDRNVLQSFTPQTCSREDSLSGPDVKTCIPGVQVDLFPATAVYLTTTVVDPMARHWVPEKNEYVVGPVRTKVYYQLAGRRLDTNHNRVDDFLEIATEKLPDSNRDGVLDQVQAK
jgi:hypothetical protein